VEEGREKQSGTQVALNPNATVGSKDTQKRVETTTLEEYQVRTVGGLKNPGWIFEAKGVGRTYLRGKLSEILAAIALEEKECRVIVQFSIRGLEDIELTQADFLWSKDFSKKKMAIVPRAIANRLLKEKLMAQDYFSHQELRYKSR